MKFSNKELNDLSEKALKARTDIVSKYGSTPSKIKGNHQIKISKKGDVSVVYGNTIKEPRIQIGQNAMDFWEFIDLCNANSLDVGVVQLIISQ